MVSKEDIGRRVLVDELIYKDIHFTNLKGTVKDYFEGGSSLAVEFDDKCVLFHACGGTCKNEHGLYVREDQVTFIDEGKEYDLYESLNSVLDDACEQASKGKGAERHANNNKYEDQVICVVGRLLKDHPFGAHAYQVIKKTIEAGRLYKIKGPEAAYQEVLGAINYAAAMNILIKEGEEK